MSTIWKHFTPNKIEGKARCNYCKEDKSYKGSSTKGLWDHFNRCSDKAALLEREKKKQEGAEAETDKLGTQPSTSTGQGSCTTTRKAKISDHFSILKKKESEQEAADELMARIMIRNNTSYLLFDDKDIKILFQKAYPNLKAFGREHFRQNVIPKMAKKTRKTICDGIGSRFFAITSDGWENPTSSPSLMSITCHYIDDDFNRKDSVLAVPQIIGEHTSENIAQVIQKALHSNELRPQRVIAMVRDDAANMKRASTLLEFDSFQCSAHFLHLVVGSALNPRKPDGEQKLIADTVQKCQKWVKYFRTRAGAVQLAKHQKKQNMAETKIPTSVPTRWNSVLTMLKSFREQRKVIFSVQTERYSTMHSAKKLKLSRVFTDDLPGLESCDFELVKEICKQLEPFEVATKKLSEEQSTASTVLPTLLNLQNFFEKKAITSEYNAMKRFATTIYEAISDRIARIENHKFLQLSMLVDKRFAYDEGIKSEHQWRFIEDIFIDYCEKDLRMCQTESDPNSDHQQALNSELSPNSERGSELPVSAHSTDDINDQIDYDSDSNTADQYVLWKTQSKSVDTVSQTSTNSIKQFTSQLRAELALYSSANRPDDALKINIFTWWRENCNQFPLISRAARSVLSVPATSVSSERLFSKAGLIYANTLRNRLRAETVQDILLIKANLTSHPLEMNDLDLDDDDEDQLDANIE